MSTNTVSQAVDWAKAHPTKDVGEKSLSWAGWCAALVYWAGNFSRSFTNAMSAGDWQIARDRLNPKWQDAPTGAIHYWAGVGGDGHTAIQINSSYLLLMASSAVTDSFGNAIGTISFRDYAAKGIPYRGWSMHWGDETLDLSGTAGGGGTPIIIDTEGYDMRIIKQPGGTIALIGEFDETVYTSASGGQAFSIGSNGKAWGIVDGLTGDEITTLVNESRARRSRLIAEVAKSVGQPVIDYDKLAQALVRAGVGTTLSDADVQRVASAVNSDASKRLSS